MTVRPTDYEVAVVGAGPVGCVAAAAFARLGARVLLLEANPKAASRFAGEWIHPPGVGVLDRLGLLPIPQTVPHQDCHGFAVFPDDGSEPIRLPYPDGDRGLSCEHGDLVAHLRARVSSLGEVTYLPHARVTSLEGAALRFDVKGEGEREVRVGRVVGADGRGSVVRRAVGGPEHAVAVSDMAGVELRDVALPFEGHGHVLLGGPGPVLLYRIGPDRARACLDLPVGHPGARRDAAYLWEAFAPHFPASLRPALRAALTERKIAWAKNRFRPRTFYGRGAAALVGDAVGFYHPLTAAGMTCGFLDAEALARAADLDAYRAERERETYVPELLSNALYQVFTREDRSAASVRASVYRVWRKSPEERRRTMGILAGSERSLRQFGGAFVHVALDAALSSAGDGVRARGARVGLSEVATLREWVRWPLATVLPRAIRDRQRPQSSSVSPLAVEEPAASAAPGLRARVTDDALGRALAEAKGVPSAPLAVPVASASELRDRQRADGTVGDVEETALAAAAMVRAGVHPAHPAVRHATRRVLEAQHADGRFERVGETAPVTTARVLSALLATGCPALDAVDAAGAFLVAHLPTNRDDRAEARAALEALAAHRRGRLAAEREVVVEEPQVHARTTPPPTPEDWALCKESLLEVSRTFARPIEMLPGKLEVAVTCGYLLCRIADTVEDNPNLATAERDVRYAAFLDVVENGAAPQTFASLWDDVEGRPEELHLCKNLASVMRVFDDLPAGMRAKTARWVAEMTRGMQLYSHRPAGDDGVVALTTVEDLERYCYFVAGTVGHMLTDLFLEELGDGATPELELALREQAEAFGVGLQLVNILKDVTDDAERRWSFIPRTAAGRQGLGMADLLDPARREDAHAAVRPLFAEARAKLDRALEYTLAIPSDHARVRLFCLLPLWMAVRTLVHAEGNDAMFVPGEPVKIARAEVEQLIGDCLTHAREDDVLRDRYAALWRMPVTPTLDSQPSAH